MTWACKQQIERLYLDREGPEDVYVDIGPSPQHQIDGIRFLYRQFKKRKPGVILNNPDGYGKTLQVTLFLETVRKLLDNPILILCENEREVENWMENLKIRTQYKEEDIVLNSPHVYVKKSIFLNKGTQLTAPYIRRDWGVVVVKNDFVPKELMKAQLKATYRVWITTIDMRKDLHMFNLIYGWMYSKKKFNVESFLDSIPNSVKPLNRMKLLKAFMDDIVIVRNEFQPMKSEATQELFNVTSKVTRKNKDATGKKIKRSKKKVEEDTSAAVADNTSVNESPKSSSTVSSTNIYEKKTEESSSEHEINLKDNNSDKVETKKRHNTETMNKEEMDVESFICDQKPIKCKEYEGMIEDISMEDHSDVLRFTEAVTDIVQTENNITVNDEMKNKGVGEVLDKSSTNISNIDEEFSEVDGKHSNVKATVIAENNKILSSLYVEENEINVEEYNNNALKGNKKENCNEDNSEIEDKEINKRNLDQKISELEEKAIKKFKGSLLDSFF